MNQKTAKTFDVRRLTTLGLLCAMAMAVTALVRIPLVPAAGFLKFDPKDVIISIGALLYGPLPGFLMCVVVALLEMFTVSESGIVGFLMNVLSSGAFVCTTAFVYSRMRSMKGAVLGLVLGVVSMTIVMLLWNYIVTPGYMGVPREKVAEMLLPVFLPFNLLKGGINAALTLLLYKPVVSVMRKRNMVPESRATRADSSGSVVAVVLFALFLLITCVLVVWALAGAG